MKIKAPARIKCTDNLGNVAYIHLSRGRGWCCTLANGTLASLFYAVGNCDEQALVFKLEDAGTDADRLAIVRAAMPSHRKAELGI